MEQRYIADCHNDLLTYAYMASKDDKILKEFVKYCENVYVNGNVKSGILTFYFMPIDEMKEEINIDITRIDENYIFDNDKSILDLIKISKDVIIKNTSMNLDNYILGIEGCTYIKDEKELHLLNQLGIQAILPVWSDINKYGSGIRDKNNNGLTKEGYNLIENAINNNMLIDVSHANSKTLDDILNMVISFESKNPKIIASHSNAKAITNHPRNLSDEQLLNIREVNGSVGVVGFKKFCLEKDKYDYYNETPDEKNEYVESYIKHIKYISDIIGSDNTLISTDDMYHGAHFDKDYLLTGVFNLYDNEYIKLYELLKKYFNKNEIENMLYKNFINIKENINEKRHDNRRYYKKDE